MSQTVINAFIDDMEQQQFIQDTVGTRIYPLTAPDGELPTIIYTPSDGIVVNNYSSSQGLRTTTVVLTVYDNSYDVVAGIRDSLESRYHGFSGELNNGQIASRIVMNTALYSLEEENSSVTRLIAEFDIIS